MALVHYAVYCSTIKLYKFYKWYVEEPAFILNDEICRSGSFPEN